MKILVRILILCFLFTFLELAAPANCACQASRNCYYNPQQEQDTQTINTDDHLELYSSDEKQDLNEALAKAEHAVSSCEQPHCKKSELAKSVYHTIPREIHKQYVDNLEFQAAIKAQRMLDVLLINIQNTELIAYPHRSDYEDEPVLLNRAIEPMSSKTPLRVKFDPDVLNLGFRPIGVSCSEILTITNYGKTEELIIISVVTDSQWLEVVSTDKIPVYINPGNSVKFQLTFTPVMYGNSTAYILFKTSNGKAYLYKIKVYGVENAFEMRPIIINTHKLGQPETIPVYIKNPFHNTPLILYCVQVPEKQIEVEYNTEGYYEPTCCPCNPFLRIPSFKKMRAFNMVFTAHTPSYIFTLVRIKGLPNFNMTLPVIIKATNGANISPSAVDFGTVNPTHSPHRIMIRVDTSREAVTIHGVLYKKFMNFGLYFPTLSQKPIVIPKSPKPTVLGYIAFHSTKPGLYENTVFIHTNHSEVTKLELRAKVVERPFTYDPVDANIDVTNKPSDRNYLHEVYLENSLNEFISFGAVEMNGGTLRGELACPYHLSNEPLKKCTRLLQPGQKAAVFHVKYSPVRGAKYPLTYHASLLGSNKLFHMPITLYDSNLVCHYTDYVYRPEGATPMVIKQKCNELDHVNLGTFSDETKAADLHFVNENPVTISMTKMALQHKSTPCCFEVLSVHNAETGILLKKYAWGKTSTFKDNDELPIPPNHIATLRIYLSLDDCSRGSAIKIADGDSFSNILTFRTGDTETKIKLQFRYHSGELSFSPSRMRFEPGFAGTSQSKELRTISTFKVPLNILRTWTTDKRTELKLNINQIKSESKTEVGVVSFTPGNTPEEQRFIALQSKVLSWAKSSITLQELKLWRERQMMWDKISSTGGTVIDAQIYLDTDIVQNVKLPVKAELTQPILVQENEVSFKLIQNGTSKQMSIQIYNPSTEPITIQLFASDPSIANYKAALPLSFAGQQKGCNGNYSLWSSKYAVTARQIRKQEKLTEYKSFEDFAEEYCCYLGKHNPALLYEETPENELTERLGKYCDSKDVASFTPVETPGVVDDAKVEASKSVFSTLWNFLFQKKETVVNKPSTVPVVSGYFSFPSTFSQYPFIVDALSYFTVGPINYTPTSIGEHSATIFIKNNLTILYPIKLKGESGVGTLEFVEEINKVLKSSKPISAVPKEHIFLKKATGQHPAEIEYKMIPADLVATTPKPVENDEGISNLWSLISYYVTKFNYYEYRVRKEHIRTFTLKNTGNMPLTVTGISIDGRGCKAYGLSVKNCKGFTIQPQKKHGISIKYSTSLAIASSKHTLTFYTKSGSQTFDLVVKLPFNLLTALQKLPALESDYEAQWRGFMLVTMILVSLYLAIALIWEQLFDKNAACDTIIEFYIKPVEKKDSSNYVASPASLYKTLSDIENARIALLNSSLRKKSAMKELCERKKLVKKNKRKRSDPTDQKNKEHLVVEPKPQPVQREEKVTPHVDSSKNDQAGNEGVVPTESPPPEKVEEKPKSIVEAKMVESEILQSSDEKKPTIILEKCEPPKPEAKVEEKSLETPKPKVEDKKEPIVPPPEPEVQKVVKESVNKEPATPAPEPEVKPKAVEPVSKVEEPQPKAEPRQTYHSRGFDYRDQYRSYQSSVYGRYSKRPGGRYAHKHPLTVYHKKSPHPSPTHTANTEPADQSKKPEELVLETSATEKPAVTETSKVKESEESKPVHAKTVSATTTPLKEDVAKENVTTSPAFRSILTGLGAAASEKEEITQSEGPIVQKPRTSSMKSEEGGGKRKGLGGVVIKLEEPIDEFEDSLEVKESKKGTETEITEEGSEKGHEQEFYKCYNPLANLDLKLPEPFTIKEEREGEEEEKQWYYGTNKRGISLFEAYKSANSLLGDRSFFSEPHPLISNQSFVSPLSELRGDSVEYIPRLQRRPLAGSDKDEVKRAQQY